VKPENYPLGSVESRAAAWVLTEARESIPFDYAACFMDGLVVMNSCSPDFVPREGMEKGPHGWVRNHKDRSNEAGVQALIKAGLLRGPKS
jgi:hypothetical protein